MRSDRLYRIEDYLGARFGSRVVLGQADTAARRQLWSMKCDCGSVAPVAARALFRGAAFRCVACANEIQRGAANVRWGGGKHVPRTVFNKWKKSADKRSIEWSVTINDLDALIENQGWKCALSGARLVFDFGMRNGCENGNASLDRIDSDLGYTVENVQFVTKITNMAKQAMTTQEFVSMCRAVVNHAGQVGKLAGAA